MATWHKIKIDQNSIEVQTAKAFLLKMPSKSAYKDYTFWVPSKLVRFARNGWNGTASFTDEFSFKVQKHGQGQYNKQEIINEKELSGSDMYKIWLDLDLAETE